MKYKNNFVIHSMKQLIDINKGLTDFNANISITSQNEDDVFDIVIVTQQNLDDIDFTLNYRQVTHYINVDVESNESDNNDYVLVIKADNKTDVDIEINLIDNKRIIPERVRQPERVQEPYKPRIKKNNSFNKVREELENELEDFDDLDLEEIDDIIEEDVEEQKTPPQLLPKVKTNKFVESYKQDNSNKSSIFTKLFNKKVLICIGIGILVCLCLYYLFFTKTKKKKVKEENFTNNDIEDNLEIVDEKINIGKKENSVKKREKSSRKKENVEMSNESLLEQLRKIRQEDN